METFINLLGLTGSIIVFAVWLPKAVSAWKNRRDSRKLSAMSLRAQYLVLLSTALWGMYAALSHAYWVAVPGLLSSFPALLAIVLLHHGRRSSTSGWVSEGSTAECVCGWRLGGDHSFFAVSPSGYGAVRPCNGTLEAGFAVPNGTLYEGSTGTLILPDSNRALPQPV